MDIEAAIIEFESGRTPQPRKEKLLAAMIKEDSDFVKRMGPDYTRPAHAMARRGVIKLPKGF